MVNHPHHYNMGNPAYEPYKVISEWGCNFNIGNAIKYLARYKQKWNPIEDLEKAKKYIDFEIERLRPTEALAPEELFKERTYQVNPCCENNLERKIVNGDELQETKPETAVKNRGLMESICRGEKIVDEANKALDEGMSRIDVMKKILKMSDDEISEVMKMDGLEDACVKIANKIAENTESVNPQKHGKYFTHF